MNTHADALHPINEADLEQMNPARREAKALGFRLDDVSQVSPKEQQAIETARKKLPVAVKAFEEMNRGRPQAHDPGVVAEIYRTAFAVGLNPTKAVAERLGITPTAAGKQVERARKKGVLEPAPRPGVPGLAKRKARKKR
jgi:hypothetical protein